MFSGCIQLYKNAGEDNIQLFDLSVIPKSHATNNCDDDSTFIPSLINKGRSDSLLSLGTLLYRVAHRLSLSVVGFILNLYLFLPLSFLEKWLIDNYIFDISNTCFLLQSPHNRARCARFLKKCLDFLDQPDQLVSSLLFDGFAILNICNY